MKDRSYLDLNYEAFEQIDEQIARTNAGRYALMRAGKFIKIFDTIWDAKTAGEQLYDDGEFSIQQFGASDIDLGIFSAF